LKKLIFKICVFFFKNKALIKLLKEDPTPQVRQKAAEAISLLSDF